MFGKSVTIRYFQRGSAFCCAWSFLPVFVSSSIDKNKVNPIENQLSET